MLNSAEHEISTAHKKLKYRQMQGFLALSLSDVVFIILINVGILTFMSRINFVLSWVEHGKSFITSGPGLVKDVIIILRTRKTSFIFISTKCLYPQYSILNQINILTFWVQVNNYDSNWHECFCIFLWWDILPVSCFKRTSKRKLKLKWVAAKLPPLLES